MSTRTSSGQRTARLFDDAVAVLGLPGAAAGVYLAGLSALSIVAEPETPGVGEALNVTVVVPAHNEQLNIEATVTSLLDTDYPAQHRRVVVVADNCSDETAVLAQRTGADVLVRTDPINRGKGFALEHGFAQALANDWTEVVVVVDADTVVSHNLLRVLTARVSGGEHAVQADYQVRNPGDSWRTRLLHIAFTAFHQVRSSGRERLGLSCGLRGNGMAFSRHALQQTPHQAHSVVEDLEYGIRLGRAGIRVAHASQAWVRGDMPADAAASQTQRDRWEGGRRLIRRTEGRALAREALRTRNPVLADLAMDVYLPPLGQLVTALSIGLVVGVGSGTAAKRQRAAYVHGIGLVGVALHVGRAWQASGTGMNGLLDLARAPSYVAWKLVRRMQQAFGQHGAIPTNWVRTARAGERNSAINEGAA